MSFVNVAAALGVSHMALYKRVDSLEALKLMVAEEIFTRWPVPHAGADTHPELRDYRSRWSSRCATWSRRIPGWRRICCVRRSRPSP
ncbi:hypothetical protein WJ968_21260 [Achromobacter xylosoxidans]